MLSPVMPWQDLARLHGDDITALVEYLKSLKPVKNRVVGPLGPTEPVPVYTLRLTPPETEVSTKGAAWRVSPEVRSLEHAASIWNREISRRHQALFATAKDNLNARLPQFTKRGAPSHLYLVSQQEPSVCEEAGLPPRIRQSEVRPEKLAKTQKR